MARRLLFLFALVGLVGCSAPGTGMTPGDTGQVVPPEPAANDYSTPGTWLCLPGRRDFCDVDLTTTLVAADGKTSVESFERNPDPPIDCFYVYPTASLDPSPNSDMVPGPGEANVIRAQFARFASVCRTFAPMYRQITLTALRARMGGTPLATDPALGYNDVADAWHYYLDHENNGRGVVLIGHSQGAGVLSRLIAQEIDGKPVSSKLVSALLIGTRLAVPRGGIVGGAFQHLSLCTAKGETGCVITYASFRDALPPPEASLFGRVAGRGMIAGCTNPAALGGGRADLHAYLSAGGQVADGGNRSPWATGTQVETPFVAVPGLLTAECVDNDHGSYLSVHVNGDPDDPRVDDIAGDVVIGGQVQAGWGLHLIDMHLAMGDLIEDVRAQGQAWVAAH
ncbi:MAG: DUF3089 domain-containing protein [Pseudomonadales bacterium]|nr:DUF3089 domain-containing protein [Pseudomonadales bacterium]